MSATSEAYLVGLVGDGVLASLSPPMHEHEADALGLRYLYRALDLRVMGRDPSEIGAILREGARLGYNAFNVTFPCKQIVLPHLDEVDDDAARSRRSTPCSSRTGVSSGSTPTARATHPDSPPASRTPTSPGSSCSAPEAPGRPSATPCSARAPSGSTSSTWTRIRAHFLELVTAGR